MLFSKNLTFEVKYVIFQMSLRERRSTEKRKDEGIYVIVLSDVFKGGAIISLSEENGAVDEQSNRWVVNVGTDKIGEFTDVEENGFVKRVYFITAEKAKEILGDRYNNLHRYRRENDTIVFYYNEDTNEKIVLAVKPGDDLSQYPFNLKERFIVTEEVIRANEVTPKKGMVQITKENLEILIRYNILTKETAHVLYYNRENVGFYL